MKKLSKSIVIACCMIATTATTVNAQNSSCNKNSSCNELKTDSVSFNETNDYAACDIFVEYPSAGCNSPLGKAVTEYIKENTFGNCNGTCGNIKEKIIAYGKHTLDNITKDAKTIKEEVGTSAIFSDYMEIRKIYETSKVVTFSYEGSSYGGGAHPMSATSYTTFIKADGTKFGFNSFKNANSPELKNIIIEGLKKYFDVKTDKELVGMLLYIDNVRNIPLPANEPALTKDGITLIYGQYEIAPYAAGMPTVTIPYEKTKYLLKDTTIIE